jgi:predicted Zn-dependent peptidase
MEEAASMLRDFLYSSDLTDGDIGAASPVMAREAGMRAGHSSAALRREIFRGLFPGHAFGRPMYGPPGRWTAPDAASLDKVRERLFHGGGTVASLVTSVDEAAGMEMLGRIFGDIDVSGDPCPGGPGDYKPVAVMGAAPGSSARLAAAWRIDGLSAEEAAALSVAAEALSRRMQLDIRETRGLSYSTGCSVSMAGGYAVVTAYLGTRGKNLTEAETALRENIEKLATDALTETEGATARSRLLSRLSRRELSCSGEAFAIGQDALSRDGKDGLRLRAEAPHGDILEAAARLEWDKALLIKLLPSENGGEKKSMPPAMMGR